MKKWILGLFALVVVAGPVSAGGIGPMMAHWDTKDAEDDQGGGVRLTADLGPNWNLELRVSWLDSFFQLGDGILFRMEAFPIDVGLSYGFDTARRVEPYVGAGFSYVDVDPNAVASVPSRRVEVRTPEEIGIFFMAGLDVPIRNDRLSLFAEAIYRSVKTTTNSTDIRDFNTDLTGLGANFGLVLNF